MTGGETSSAGGLHPYFADRLSSIAGLSMDMLWTDPQARERFEAYLADEEAWTPPPGVRIEDHAASDKCPVPVRVYIPEEPAGTPLVWLHGGGFAFGDLDMLEAHAVAAELSARARSVVVSVDYRLASESVRYPLPVDDVVAAWRWAQDALGLEAPALGGASAGAALAVSAALRCARGGESGAAAGAPVPALLLAYPFLHFPNPAPDAALATHLAPLPPVLRLTSDTVTQLVLGYVGRISDVPAEAMPGAARLDGLPPTCLAIAGVDDLRPSAELFAAQLGEVGVPVTVHLGEGMPHGFLNRVPAVPGVSAALDALADALAPRPVLTDSDPTDSDPTEEAP